LGEIIIRTGGSIKIKGDTTVYTADSFNVSANANVEELLKKLPGIQVDKNGDIKAMGEKVQKVLVDGEEFFGDDPGMAVKNLQEGNTWTSPQTLNAIQTTNYCVTAGACNNNVS